MAKEYQTAHPWAMVAEECGHNLKRDEDDGRIDMFAMAYDFCNGPRCVDCGMSWCCHCTASDNIKRCTGK